MRGNGWTERIAGMDARMERQLYWYGGNKREREREREDHWMRRDTAQLLRIDR